MKFNSSLYSGTLRHRRSVPVAHEFEYNVSMLYLDLDEIEEIFSGAMFSSGSVPAPWWFRRRDFLRPRELELKDAIRKRVVDESRTIASVDAGRGPIRLLTTVRTLGFSFNPISVYYCFCENGESLQHLIAEVTNTPWLDRHAYVIPVTDKEPTSGVDVNHRFQKRLHVSPFNAMNIEYHWQSTIPSDRIMLNLSARKTVESESSSKASHQGNPGPFFDATLQIEKKTITKSELRAAMIRQPFTSWLTVFRIYREALGLWRKGAPVYPPAAQSAHRTGENSDALD